MIHEKEEIMEGLETAFDHISYWFANQPDVDFAKDLSGKWSSGQHLDHLIRSVVPLNMILNKPKLVIRALFGKPNRPGLTLDQLVEKYQSKLAAGGKATGQFIPKPIATDQKEKLLQKYQKEKNLLLRRLADWHDHQLDAYLLPHPLLGKLTIREMLFFTIYHTQHHLNSLQDYYTSTNS